MIVNLVPNQMPAYEQHRTIVVAFFYNEKLPSTFINRVSKDVSVSRREIDIIRVRLSDLCHLRL